MKTLLINPYVPLEVVYGPKYAQIGAVMPPLGILYIASHLKKGGKHEVAVLDANVLGLSPEETAARAEGFACAGISATTLGYPYAVETARRLKARFPSIKLLFGGPHAQAAHEEVLRENPGLFDFVCYAEGEYAVEQALEHFEGRLPKDAVLSMCYSGNGAMVKNPPAEIPEDLDVFGHPAEVVQAEYVPLYHEKILAFKRLPMFSIFSSRGCPFCCTFCSTPNKFAKMYGGKLRRHSPAWIGEEMELLSRRLGVREVAFMDDTFNLSKQRVLDLGAEIARRGIDMAWTCNFKAHICDDEMLLVMKRAGCWGIMVGAESGSDRVLKFIKKGVTSSQLYDLSVAADRAGIFARASFILGLPSDTPESIEETLAFAKKARFHFPYFQLYIPLPGTEMFGQLEQYGRIIVKDPKQRSASRVNYLPAGMDADYLQGKFDRCHKDTFLHPAMVLRHLKFIRSIDDVKRYWTGLGMMMSGS